MTAPVTRVEYVVFTKVIPGLDRERGTAYHTLEQARWVVRECVPSVYRIIERTITERVLAPEEEG
jgi:hypothetical protein